MPLSIATWNINSVRLRAGLVLRFLEAERPDVLCLQETKCPEEKFPGAAFAEMGYRHLVCRGHKGYHGVAILARVPLRDLGPGGDAGLCRNGHPRHAAARLPDGTVVHSLYVPAGGDEPDPAKNEKFAHKLDFLERMAAWSAGLTGPHVLAGDLNVAPLEHDVWSHRQMLKVISHTPAETERLARVQAAGAWHDPVRADRPEPQKVYSWWSYRAKDWAAADRGRRLDHVWTRGGVRAVPGSTRLLKAWRGSERPSDHVPVVVELERA